MKFSCERCGKKYATAETPAPGRVYKVKCKACGHLIVVKGSAATKHTATTELPPPPLAEATTPTPTPTPTDSTALAAAPPPVPAASPSLDLEFAPPEPAGPGPALEPLPPEPPPPPPATESGYVDLFGESKSDPAAADLSTHATPADGPFVAAARASLPETYGQSAPAPDPFAPLREELDRTSPGAAASPAATQSAMKVPVIAKPPQRKSNGPIVLIAAGGLVLVGILAFVLIGGKKAAAPAPQPPAQVQAPALAPAPPPPAVQPAPTPASPAEAAAPAQSATEPKASTRGGSDDDRRAREERRQREREAKQAREEKARADGEARDRDRQRKEAEKTAAASPAEPGGVLSQDDIQKVLSSTRKAFERCIVTSGNAREVKLDGRRVMLRLNIQPNGAVTYPTLDDVTLNGTDLGQCLKSAARLMVFPKFKADTMHVEVPLVLAGGK